MKILKEMTTDLLEIETLLTSHEQFGDWQSIINRNLTFYCRGIELLAKSLPEAAVFLSVLSQASDERKYRVLSDPIVRDALNSGLSSTKAGLSTPTEQVKEVLSAALPLLEEYKDKSPLEQEQEESLRIGIEPYHLWVWTDVHSSGYLSNYFKHLFEREIAESISSQTAVLRKPTKEMEDTLIAGEKLLHDLLPSLSRSSLIHVQVAAIVDVSDREQWNETLRSDLCQNVSTHAIPGTIFLSPTPLRTAWYAAEALLHEALHKKLSDLVLTRSIFRSGFSSTTSQVIRSVWNRPVDWNSNDWSIDRALFAFHVYVHLGLFFAVVESKGKVLEQQYGSMQDMNPPKAKRNAFNRARYLGQKLKESSGNELGPDGHLLVDWLFQILNQADPFPPQIDLEMHLLLDRFDQETKDISVLIASIPPSYRSHEGDVSVDANNENWSICRIVDHLVHSEVVAAYRILSILGEAESPSFNFYNGDQWSITAQSKADFSDLASTFQALRKFVSLTLRNAKQEVFDLPCTVRSTKTLRDVVEDMVEHASRHINFLVNHLNDS